MEDGQCWSSASSWLECKRWEFSLLMHLWLFLSPWNHRAGEKGRSFAPLGNPAVSWTWESAPQMWYFKSWRNLYWPISACHCHIASSYMPLCTYSPQGLQSTLEHWALSNLVLFRGLGSLWGLWLLHQLSARLLADLSQEVLLFLAHGGSYIPPGQMDVAGLTLNGPDFITVSHVWCPL